MISNFGWLHLSDLHVGQKSHGWLWPNFKSNFLEDLRKSCRLVGNIDVVIFSGDLTQRGSQEEYQKLSHVLQEIWECLDKEGHHPSLFPVPGNHDLVRPPSSDPYYKLLRRWWEEEDVREEFWADKNNKYLGCVNSCFENYENWLSEVEQKGITIPSLMRGIIAGDCSASIDIRGSKIGLVGLNSAFLQLDGDDYEGKLALDVRQLLEVTNEDTSKWCQQNAVNFLVTHHPASWLSNSSKAIFDTEINPAGRFTAHLYGHMHDADAVTLSRAGGAQRKTVQAASLFGLETLGNGTTKRVHGYSLGRISHDGGNASWRFWPRHAVVGRDGNRRIAPDYVNFTLNDEQCFVESLTSLATAANTSETADNTLNVSVEVSATLEDVTGDPIANLAFAEHFVQDEEQHISVRQGEQQSCVAALTRDRCVWLSADWGMGSNGFLYAMRRRLNHTETPVFRIDLSEYKSQNDFLSSFHNSHGISFAAFCDSLSLINTATLILNEAPTSNSDPIGQPIEREVEWLAKTVLDYCVSVNVFIYTRAVPKRQAFTSIELKPLDEADTKVYLLHHPNANGDAKSSRGVSDLYRMTDGVPGKLDRAIKNLRLVSLSELAATTTSVDARSVMAQEAVPRSLVNSVAEIFQSTDPDQKRTATLLKLLTILPNGETLERIKYFINQKPIHMRHAEELLDRGLIETRDSLVLINKASGNEEKVRILSSPRPVRDYVMTTMTPREIETYTSRAAAIYFGDNWQRSPRMKRRGNVVSASDDHLLHNPHSLGMRLLLMAVASGNAKKIETALNVLKVYCGVLWDSELYRLCVSVCRDVLTALPSTQFDGDRLAIEFQLGRNLRMINNHDEAEGLLKKYLDSEPPKANRVSALQSYALCLQSRNKVPEALAAANEIIKLDPKSNAALQAKSIILALGDSENKSTELAKLEDRARRKGAHVVANNIVLSRLSAERNGSDSARELGEVVDSALKGGDRYNAWRAVVMIASDSIKAKSALSVGHLKKTLAAYHYFYDQRLDALFLQAHQALWEIFDANEDMENLLQLFRHSSFIWRLSGFEKRERDYIGRITKKYGHKINPDILSTDLATTYFLTRAQEYKTVQLQSSVD